MSWIHSYNTDPLSIKKFFIIFTIENFKGKKNGKKGSWGSAENELQAHYYTAHVFSFNPILNIKNILNSLPKSPFFLLLPLHGFLGYSWGFLILLNWVFDSLSIDASFCYVIRIFGSVFVLLDRGFKA